MKHEDQFSSTAPTAGHGIRRYQLNLRNYSGFQFLDLIIPDKRLPYTFASRPDLSDSVMLYFARHLREGTNLTKPGVIPHLILPPSLEYGPAYCHGS